MFDLNCRFQIAAILVLLIIVVDYAKNPHLNLRSSKYFKALMVLTGVNLCLDLSTVYTITHLTVQLIPLNRLLHQLFIGSVVLTLFCEYLYIRMLAGNQRRMRLKEMLITLFPIVVAGFVIATGKLEYYVSDKAVYSYGPMAYVVYICGVTYLLMGLKMAFNKKGYMSRNQRSSVLLGFLIWTVVMTIQVVFPQLLLSGLGFVLLVLSIYFSYETQKENYDPETDCFNRNAFNKMLAENYAKKKPLYVITLTCENLDRIDRIAGKEMSDDALKYLRHIFAKHTGKAVYHFRDNVFSIFLTKNIAPFMNKLQALEAELAQEKYKASKLNSHISVLDLRKYTTSWHEVEDLIDFMTEKMQYNGSQIYFLNEEIVKSKERRDQIDVLLEKALENDGFEMYYQPIFNGETKKFTSAEALIRLKDCGNLGYVSPEEFIPQAEEKGLILDIGDRVLELVAEFASRSKLVDSSLEYIEVNLSAIQAVTPRLDERFKAIVDKYHLPPSFINLEITETATVDFGDNFSSNIKKLRDMGFSFSMDDFGTGYSNLAQMNQIRYNLVKLDKSLIWPAFEESEDREQAEKLLGSVISLLKTIGVQIVAEGVETEEMANYLIEKGVEHLQGYYYSRPVTPGKFLLFINEHA